MDTPKDILTRAARHRRSGPFPGPVRPAPAPHAIDEPPPEGRAVPKPAGHTLYRELMRSHDRMGTRHLNGPG